VAAVDVTAPPPICATKPGAPPGIAPERLIFAPKLELMASGAPQSCRPGCWIRLPYNAHTNRQRRLIGRRAGGLPVLGEAFAGRVGASLLTAIGLPELIADDLEGYESSPNRWPNPETYKALKAEA